MQEKLWTKPFIMVSLINFILMLSMFLLLVTIGGYAVDEYNVSTSTAGLVSGIFIVGSLFGRFWAGKSIDVYGQKQVMIIGVIIFVVTTALYFVSFNLTLLLIVRFLNGMGNGIASTATGTIAAFITPMKRRGEGISYFSMSTVMATAIGPFLGLSLLQVISFRQLFVFCLILAIIGLIMLPQVTVNQDVKRLTSSSPSGFNIKEYIDVNAIPIALVVLICCTAYSSVLSFISFFAKENNLITAGSFFFLTYAIVVLISRPVTGKLMDNKGTNIVMYPALIAYFSGLLTLSFTHTSWMLILSAALLGFGYGNFQSIAQAIAVKVTDHEKMGLATSTYFIFLDFALGFGPYILGIFIPAIGLHGLYRYLSFFVIIGIVAYYFLHGRKAHLYN
ncbi:MFS transporter [Macrococcus armenti]|uniref:MFS transporter n=1 Tax=Macrococcus armenti TaxID=2875764 RepID=UPI001CCA258A|nr:MFS transporter [Macrococcus armenti]UBH08750.1 MFS transporter [Macrococcus armenti]UBH11047.1 MFS transporter [Macrococcus armenti]UBH15526.1 MFS transporter [Macrococcus armenti]UBH17886.1 MFS transporter [Macrococcus armenti]UBH20152.1 MFS transporter [Macrococcus armenti]